MLAVMSAMSAQCSPSSSSAHKRPRGLWKGRRDATPARDPKTAILSHDIDSDLEDDNSKALREDSVYDDDLEDTRSSTSSSSKRRRLTGAFSDIGSPWPPAARITRSLTPEMYYVPSPPHALASMVKQTPSPFANESKGKQPSPSDYEDWENLKELFARAADLCESDDLVEALPLLRAVIRECHRLLTLYPDPSVIYAAPPEIRQSRSPVEVVTPTDERLNRDWGQDSLDSAIKSSSMRRTRSHTRREELPTAFHATFGIALFLMGNIMAQDASLALLDEPSSASTWWLAALDVFETGESLPCLIDGRGGADAAEDWRMAIAWGRTLVCLADEKISSAERAKAEAQARATSEGRSLSLAESWAYMADPGPFTVSEPTWPKDSVFYTIAMNRPPVTRRMSLFSASAHDIMVLATDQFSRGIFHMPHPTYSQSHNPTHIYTPSRSPSALLLTPGTPSPSSTASPAPSYFFPQTRRVPPARSSTLTSFSRPKELFTIASEILGVAERLPDTGERQYWATWADSVFNQMKMEADMDSWRGAVTRARGRCWLVVGSSRAEDLEDALERGDMDVLMTENAEEAREGLLMAISFFERAKGSATAMVDEDAEDISPLLAEALLTLANLTVDENKREELYARAQAEGVSLDSEPEMDTSQNHATPPPVSRSVSVVTTATASSSSTKQSSHHHGAHHQRPPHHTHTLPPYSHPYAHYHHYQHVHHHGHHRQPRHQDQGSQTLKSRPSTGTDEDMMVLDDS